MSLNPLIKKMSPQSVNRAVFISPSPSQTLWSNVREDLREDLADILLAVCFHNPSHVSYISAEHQIVHVLSAGCTVHRSDADFLHVLHLLPKAFTSTGFLGEYNHPNMEIGYNRQHRYVFFSFLVHKINPAYRKIAINQLKNKMSQLHSLDSL